MIQSVKEDIYRYEGERWTILLVRSKYALFPGTRTLWLIRHYQAASNPFTRILWKVLCYLDKYSTGVQIPPQTKKDKGCRILHFGTIVIHPDSVIGKNFNIAQGTLIGSNTGKRCGSPIIGNNVCMFANSIVLGGGKHWR